MMLDEPSPPGRLYSYDLASALSIASIASFIPELTITDMATSRYSSGVGGMADIEKAGLPDYNAFAEKHVRLGFVKKVFGE